MFNYYNLIKKKSFGLKFNLATYINYLMKKLGKSFWFNILLRVNVKINLTSMKWSDISEYYFCQSIFETIKRLQNISKLFEKHCSVVAVKWRLAWVVKVLTMREQSGLLVLSNLSVKPNTNSQ